MGPPAIDYKRVLKVLGRNESWSCEKPTFLRKAWIKAGGLFDSAGDVQRDGELDANDPRWWRACQGCTSCRINALIRQARNEELASVIVPLPRKGGGVKHST